MAEGMQLGEINLKGWPAVAVIVAVIGYVVYSLAGTHNVLGNDDIVATLEERITRDMTRSNAAQIDDAADREEFEEVSALADRIRDADVDFYEVHASEPVIPLATGGEIIVYVRFSTSDDPGEQTRYYRLERAGFTGWRVLREVSAWSWWLAKF